MKEPKLIDFVNWLDTKPDDEVVGKRLNSNACPCAECFTEVYGKPVEVYPSSVDIADYPFQSVKTPKWLSELVERIDGTSLGKIMPVDAPVTAGEVRRHLVNILARNK